MFLNFLKKFLLKRKLKKALSSLTSELSDEKIKTVGLIIDETYFTNKNQVVEDLQAQGIEERNINLLLYHDKDKKRDLTATSFSMKNVSWSGAIDDKKVVSFEAQRFDLLISYYDLETAALLWVTQRSKARFKVGFSTIDKRLNHLMIQTTAENNTIFIQELFKYLRILNKI
jgi:Tol biopolymer transport system component